MMPSYIRLLNSTDNGRTKKLLTCFADYIIFQNGIRGTSILNLTLANKEELVNAVEIMGASLMTTPSLDLLYLKGNYEDHMMCDSDYKNTYYKKLTENNVESPWSETLTETLSMDESFLKVKY